MPLKKSVLASVLFLAVLSACPMGLAADSGLVSSQGLAFGANSVDGFQIAQALDVAAPIYSDDLAPTQVLEIVRPQMRAFSVGRLMTSCSCLKATLTKRDFADGERALLEVRNVKPTPKDGAKYAVFVQIVRPFAETLQYDMFVQSGASAGAAVGATVPAPSPLPGFPQAEPPQFRYEDIVPYSPR